MNEQELRTLVSRICDAPTNEAVVPIVDSLAPDDRKQLIGALRRMITGESA